MDRHRMRGELGPALLPRPAVPAPSFSGFMLCCVPCSSAAHGLWVQELYRWALAEAQAVVRPSLPERDLLAVWN
jgi:hypothetical protein